MEVKAPAFAHSFSLESRSLVCLDTGIQAVGRQEGVYMTDRPLTMTSHQQ